MAIPSDLDIARAALLKPLDDIAHELGIGEHLLEPYGESVVLPRRRRPVPVSCHC